MRSKLTTFLFKTEICFVIVVQVKMGVEENKILTKKCTCKNVFKACKIPAEVQNQLTEAGS